MVRPRLRRRVNAPVHIHVPDLVVPIRKLGIDLVVSIRAHARRGPVGRQSQDDVMVHSIDGPRDLPLVGPEAEVRCGEELRGRPRRAVLRDLEMQIPVRIDDDVARIPLRDSGHPARGDVPVVALPRERARSRLFRAPVAFPRGSVVRRGARRRSGEDR